VAVAHRLDRRAGARALQEAGEHAHRCTIARWPWPGATGGAPLNAEPIRDPP
jgi:hypothetical protein